MAFLLRGLKTFGKGALGLALLGGLGGGSGTAPLPEVPVKPPTGTTNPVVIPTKPGNDLTGGGTTRPPPAEEDTTIRDAVIGAAIGGMIGLGAGATFGETPTQAFAVAGLGAAIGATVNVYM